MYGILAGTSGTGGPGLEHEPFGEGTAIAHRLVRPDGALERIPR